MDNNSKQRGFSLVEIMITVGIAGLVMVAITPVLIATLKQQKAFEAKSQSKSYHRVLERVMQKAFILIRPEHFVLNQSYFYNADGVTDTNPMALQGNILKPFDESMPVVLTGEGGAPAFLSGAPNILSEATTSIQLNSFTLGLMSVKKNPVTEQFEGQVSRVFMARCIPNTPAYLDGATGSAIDRNFPVTSFRKIFGANRYPYMRTDAQGNLRVYCCEATASEVTGAGCTDGYPQWIPRIYMTFFTADRPTSILELPEPSVRESVGTGFILAFNRQTDPDYFRVIIADLENLCETQARVAQTCESKNPSLYKEPGAATTSGVTQAEFENVIRARSFVRFGRVSNTLDSAGVIILGESNN